jgi:hypothetical protein
LAVGSASRSLNSLGLSVITNATTDKQELLERWLNLEKDPEIITAELLELTNEIELQSASDSFNSTANNESLSDYILPVESFDCVAMETNAEPVMTEPNVESIETNHLTDADILSVPTDQPHKPLTEIEKIDVSRILESAKYMMEIAAESNNPVLIEITRQSFLKLRDDIQSNFGDF